MPSKKQPKKPVDPGYVCGFCKKKFVRENTLAVHMCTTKMRHMAKEEQPVRMAFRIWLRFYEVNTTIKNKTWDDFIRSPHYNDFFKVGQYITDLNAVNTPQFIDFLIRSGLPVVKWTSAPVYETYIRELAKKETPDAAIERCISLMQHWAGSSGEQWTDFFRKVSPAQATMWIKNGRLSPWVLYISGSSVELFDRMSPEQLSMVKGYLDPGFWAIRINRHNDEVDFFRQVLEEAGV